MSYLIFTILGCALFHFIYEGVIAPSLRLNLRFKLFALRDDLRSLKIDNKERLNDKHFEYLHESINATIAFLYQFDIATLNKVQKLQEQDKGFKDKISAREKILDDCYFEDAKKIRRRTVRVAANAFLVNCGAWIFYLLPIVIVVLCVSALKDKIKDRIRALTAIPEKELERRFHLEGTIGAVS